MNLERFRNTATSPIPLGLLGADQELVSDIQTRFVSLGLLDPPVDGKFGPVSKWALRVCCQHAHLSLDNGFSPAAAAFLLSAAAEDQFPVRPQTDFAGRVVQAMRAKRFWIACHPECRNIVYIEGSNLDGTPNDNKPNRFNDIRLIISINDDGVPIIVGAWDGTTEPSRRWTLDPMHPAGAARIAFGQYKAWAVGTHHAGQSSAHEALVQVTDVTVHRDLNKDFQRDGDRTFTGLFGINQHWGYNLSPDDLGNSSAGCLVGRTKTGHREFMAMVKQDPRYVASNSYRFMSTVMSVADLRV